MQTPKIGFIGSGNMATSIIGGLASDSTRYSIYAFDPDSDKLSDLKTRFGVIPCSSNSELVQRVDIVILSIKPQLMQKIVSELAPDYAKSSPMIISIAAGIRCHQILTWLDCDSASCIRVMPNTPALVGEGACGLFAINASEPQKQLAETIMNAVGISIWVDNEKLIDSVTGVSGSGPAYFFYLMEAIYNAAIKNGLDESVARQLTLQTALGAARLAGSSDVDFKTLRMQVTSPGGTTEAAINSLKANNFAELVENAVNQAVIRSNELS